MTIHYILFLRKWVRELSALSIKKIFKQINGIDNEVVKPHTRYPEFTSRFEVDLFLGLFDLIIIRFSDLWKKIDILSVQRW